MASRIWIDPPQGWRWGFPKVYDPNKDGNPVKWLVAQGYPQAEVDALGANFHWRQWEVEPEDEVGNAFKRGLQVKPGEGSDA